MNTKTFKLRSLTGEDQIKKFGKVLVTPDSELELVKSRSKYALVENVEFCSNEVTEWIHVDDKDEITPEAFIHPFANKLGYTDVYPYEVVEVKTALKMIVRELDAELDPNWKMDFIPGGFVGHVTNNRSQTYTYTSNPENDTRAIRYSKAKKGWFDKHGNRYSVSTSAYKFHDYNF